MRIVRYQHPRALAPRRFAGPGTWADLENEIDRMIGSAFENFFDLSPRFTASYPRADFFEDKDNFYLRAELPGLKREDVHVEVGDGVLTVSGTRKTFSRDGETESANEFSRSVSVPARVQEDKVSARYEDGVLTITLPKAEEAKPKKIAVQVK